MKKFNISKSTLIKLYIKENKSLTQIAKLFNSNRETVRGLLKKYNIKSKKRYIKDFTNQRFGKLLVLKLFNKKGSSVWTCKCDCGIIKNIRGNSLQSGYTKSCGCLRTQTQQNNRLYKGCGELGGHFWGFIRCNAKIRKINFNITIQEAWDLFLKQNRKCALSGLELKFHSRTNISDGTASLDRIDSSKGYTIDNIQWVHKDINLMKQTLSDQKLIEYCILIVEYNK